MTSDGQRIEVGANIASADEVPSALEQGAEGIGLFRTEMLFLDRDAAPSEDEQYESYCRAARTAGGLPVIIRLLDVGGDKPAPYLNLPDESNPFLGQRGVRVYAARPELIRTQLRAIHRVLAIGQVEGSVYMGLGEALMEEMAYRGDRFGVHKIPSLLEYKSPTTKEMPEVVTYLVEDPDPQGPFGAKEVGQGPLLPIMPAVANAVFDALGVRVDQVPITPDLVMKALASKDRRAGPRSSPATTGSHAARGERPTPSTAATTTRSGARRSTIPCGSSRRCASRGSRRGCRGSRSCVGAPRSARSSTASTCRRSRR